MAAILSALRKDGVLPAKRQGRQAVLDETGVFVDLFRKQQKVLGLDYSAARLSEQAATFFGTKQVRVYIDWRTRHDQSRNRIQPVVLDDANNSAWFQHAKRLVRKRGALLHRHVVIHAYDRKEVETLTVERKRQHGRLRSYIKIRTRLEQPSGRIATSRRFEMCMPKPNQIALSAADVKPVEPLCSNTK